MFDFMRAIDSPKIQKIGKCFNSGISQNVFGLAPSAQGFLISQFGKGSIFVAKDLVSASKMAEFLSGFNFRVQIITSAFTSPLGLEDDNLKNDFFSAISLFVCNQCDCLIVLSGALSQKVPSREALRENLIKITTGQDFNFSTLSGHLVRVGYEKKPDVYARGEFSIKGDIITIWPLGSEHILRLEFFDETLEKITKIVPETKKASGRIESFIVPAISLSAENKNVLWLSENVFFEEPILLENQVNALEYGADLLDKNSIFKHIPQNAMAFSSVAGKSFFQASETLRLQTENGQNYLHSLKDFVQELKSYVGSEKEIYIFCGNVENALRLNKILEENFVFTARVSGEKTNIHVREELLTQTVYFHDAGAIFFGTHNLFGRPKKTVSTPRRTKIFVPKVGEYVVHDMHGIGKCVGLEKMALNGYEKDYIIIEYAGGDRFYLPSEQGSALSLYSSQGAPKLNRLGGADFARAKEKVYKSVRAMAFDLLKLYALREKVKGNVYVKDDYLMQEFENAFVFEETPDQLRAIEEIKADMESEKVMDRLVCGDVGFGKTEVALRAIYKAVLSGSQVAFLCPTTVLAQQHFSTCLKRFSGFMVKTARFNRLMTKKEETETLQGLKDGSINVVVGTHKLLSKNVEFKNLTLLVLDEEQRFGVEDKEKIKNLKKNVDVLSLSATPIPRTLHMSLSGIRDISIIATPPRVRQPVQTFVTEFDEGLIQKAVRQELGRGGQVLVIFNNIEKIYEFASFIKKLTPSATVGVAHGRLAPKVLEDTIFKLYAGEYQILVSTTLIENGIDLPTANTLIVVDADRLGLAQAYQIRGRIGRSDKVAYAYFLVKENKEMSENAFKRLSALMENTSLGSGLKIAMADLDIRGAGNVLGKEQSGNMIKVGYDLYYKLLALALKEVKGEGAEMTREVKIQVPISAFVPEDFVESEDERLKMISEISMLATREAVKDYLQTLTETFSKVPVEVENLAKISLLKNVAQKSGAKTVQVTLNGYKIQFYEKNEVISSEMGTIPEVLERVLGYFEKQMPDFS